MAVMNQTWGEWYDANLRDSVPKLDPRSDAWAKKIADILMEDDVAKEASMAKHPTRKPIKRK